MVADTSEARRIILHGWFSRFLLWPCPTSLTCVLTHGKALLVHNNAMDEYVRKGTVLDPSDGQGSVQLLPGSLFEDSGVNNKSPSRHLHPFSNIFQGAATGDAQDLQPGLRKDFRGC